MISKKRRSPSAVIAVLIPCYNEERAVARVVADFRRALPEATVYVYDNQSSDRTYEVAQAAGAIVRREPQQGKGFVVRRMFADIEADIYVLVDGDDTYDAAAAPGMISMLLEQRLDMTVGSRITGGTEAYPRGHRFGNRLFTRSVARLFGERFRDILSGYRVLSRRFVKSFPVSTGGFEIETEITVHALRLGLAVGEVETSYRSRPEGSASKLGTYRDGVHILFAILRLFREERPLTFFSIIGSVLIAAALALGYRVLAEFLATGLVPHFPSAILATGLVLSGLLSFVCGLVLDTVTRGRLESKFLAYLSVPAYDADRGARESAATED